MEPDCQETAEQGNNDWGNHGTQEWNYLGSIQKNLGFQVFIAYVSFLSSFF